MSPKVVILALFFILTLLPQGWNKFDNTPHATLIYLLAPLLVFLLVLSWKKLALADSGPQKITAWAGLLLGVLFAMAFLFSPVKNFGWSEVVVMLSGVSIFFLMQQWREDERQKFLFIIIVIALLVSIFGLAQYLIRDEARIAGAFFVSTIKARYWPNAFALFLLMAWPLTLFFRYESKNILKKCFNVLLTVLPITALILTFSRAAFLVFLLQLTVLAWVFRKKIFSRTVVASIISTSAIILVLVFSLHTIRTQISFPTNSFLAKATFRGTEQQTSFQERVDFMRGALTLTKDHPWTGSGPFSFRFLYPQIQPDFLAVSDHPHNWYLKIALEEGIPAATVFFIFLGSIFYAKRKVFQGDDLVSLDTILLISLLGPLFHNLVDYNMNFLTNQLLFWTILSCFFASQKNAVAQTAIQTAAQTSPSKSPITPLATILATGVFALSGFIGMEGYSAVSKEYDKLLFSRNHTLETARYFAETADSEKALTLTKRAISLNPYDAFAWNFYGHLLEEKKEPEALSAYENALKNDPANFFNFYIDYFTFARKLKLTDTATYKYFESLALEFLDTYPEKVRQNVHYTAQSGNVEDAIRLAKLLEKPQQGLRIRRAFRSYQTSKSR